MSTWTAVDWWLFATGAVIVPFFTATVMSVIYNMRKRREFNRMAEEFNRQVEEERKRDKIEE